MKTDNFIHYDLERLRAIPIKSVASQFGKLKPSGSTCMTICPWHADHHPSLSLVEREGKNYCHCFSCGKGGDVIDYVMKAMDVDFRGACEWLSNQYGVPTSTDKPYTPIVKQKPMKENYTEKPHHYIPTEKLDELVTTENSLCQCLMQIFLPQKVEWVTEEYRIGCYELYGYDNCTVFPNIDYNGRVCNMKIQWYDSNPNSQSFTHCKKGLCYWLGSMWEEKGLLPANTHYTTKTLFGEHLLPIYPAQTVALVESPKNALLGALEYPKMLWLAVGNKGALKREHMEPLRGRDVIVIPDCDAIELWEQSITKMRDIANFTISDFCRQVAPVDKPKYDIADYIIDKHLKGV